MPPAVSRAARRVFRTGILNFSFSIPKRTWTDSTRPFILRKRADPMRRCVYRACKHGWCAHARWRWSNARIACVQSLWSAEQRGHGRQMRAVAGRRFARACARALSRDNIRAQVSHSHPGPRWAHTGRRRLPEPRLQQPVSDAQKRPPRRWTLKLAPSAAPLPRCGGPGAARAPKSSASRARTP